ncbi:MAG: FAD-binding protein [Gemmatimonadetes bacterium]|nr:FAD-binding protein [Gemmatimonadota bacterium]MBT8405769.1 FAD-binding protein [Gemmatimonadota bacterium]NNF39716.1 FAD-binding protein [Gemmatimonadota bacterium]
MTRSAPSPESARAGDARPPAVPPAALVRDLRGRLGREAVLTDPDRLLVYEADGLPHYRRRPAAVVLPRDTEETAWAVERLHGAGIPIVPRGAGTGLSGGAIAAPGAVLVGTARMRSIVSLDPANRRARVQAGVLNADLSTAAEPYGLHYAPDPSSQTACTLGGNVAENSGGPHCLKYGVTSRYVTGLTVVGADGRVVRLGGCTTAAPDWVGLFVGSEGCFGIATEIEVRLVPRTPGVRTLLAVFSRLEDAGAAVSAIIAAGLLPAALEILDRATIRAVEESVFAAGYPKDAGAVLVVEFDGLEEELDEDAERADALCRTHGASRVERAREAADRARLWKGRKKAFGALGRLAPDMVVQDATVPRSRLPEVLSRIDEIADRHRLLIANVFHAGDGNLHPNLLFDRRDPDQLQRVESASREIMAVCVDAGGTITGEHGVGLDKRRYMTLVHGPEELRAQEGVRGVFDPRRLWNPGKVLPERGGDAAEPTVPPEDVAALARLLRKASDEGRRLSPARRLDPEAARIDLTTLSGIEHYEPADLTLTAGAGTSLESISARTAAAGQWLPIDGPGLDEATLGAVAAAGVHGTLWSGFGAMRDLVLGLTVVTGDGRVLRLGGRVVKNVAGFDLVRLMIGSRGALGVIASVTVRLYPRPAAERWWMMRASRPEDLLDVVEAVRGAVVDPSAMELGWDASGATLLVRSLGSEERVTAFSNEIVSIGGLTPVDAAAIASTRREARRALEAIRRPVRFADGPAELGSLIDRARRWCDREERPFAGWAIVDRAELGLAVERDPAPDVGSSHSSGRVPWSGEIKRFFDPSGVLPCGPFGAADTGDSPSVSATPVKMGPVHE